MSATDTFNEFAAGMNGPAVNGVAVTASDSADLTNVTRALWIGTSGNVAVTLLGMADGTSIILKNAAGMLSVRAKRVWAAGTTAADIVALI